MLRDAPALDTGNHPFFTALGPNGRACVTCHQPADGMSLAAATARERWEATSGRDPLFAAIDGSNCPNLPQQDPASHSLLLSARTDPRVHCPGHRATPTASAIDPEFTLEVVRDPTGCNTHPVYGVGAPEPRRVGLSPTAPGGQHQVHDARELRRAAVHRQERTARHARSGNGHARRR